MVGITSQASDSVIAEDNATVDLATQLYFQYHRQLGIFNNPEIAELEEGGYMAKAKEILKIKDDNTVHAITIIKPLIPQILENRKVRTFRNRRFLRKFYQVYCTSYPNRRCKACPHCVIEMQEVVKVKAKDIKNSWAKDAGIKDRKTLLKMLREWYGPVKEFWMHTFILKEIIEH